MLAPLALDAPEIDTLEACALRGPHPRMRRRAQAVLAHHRGLCIDQLVTAFGVQRNAVSRWLSRWQRFGLAEGHRAGRPPTLPETAQKK
jgi:transposase